MANGNVLQLISELQAKLGVQQTKLELLEEAKKKYEAQLEDLHKKVEGRRLLRISIWTVVVALGGVMGFLGWDFAAKAKETMADSLKSSKSTLEAYVAVDAQRQIETEVRNELGRRASKLDRLNLLSDRLSIDPLSGEVVLTCNKFRIERPQDMGRASQRSYFELGFSTSWSSNRGTLAPALVVVDDGQLRFDADYSDHPHLKLWSGVNRQGDGWEEFLVLAPGSLVMSEKRAFGDFPATESLHLSLDGPDGQFCYRSEQQNLREKWIEKTLGGMTFKMNPTVMYASSRSGTEGEKTVLDYSNGTVNWKMNYKPK